MAQDHILLALRKRMKKRGYEDIHIYKITEIPYNGKFAGCTDLYKVVAVEPFSGAVVERVDHLLIFASLIR